MLLLTYFVAHVVVWVLDCCRVDGCHVHSDLLRNPCIMCVWLLGALFRLLFALLLSLVDGVCVCWRGLIY